MAEPPASGRDVNGRDVNGRDDNVSSRLREVDVKRYGLLYIFLAWAISKGASCSCDFTRNNRILAPIRYFEIDNFDEEHLPIRKRHILIPENEREAFSLSENRLFSRKRDS